ncbi:MAG: hypothetical protein MI924_39060 [Chloroflexales bacterium]|nr:hypothetical protein [Chloroflexales bacterium]
MASKCKRKLPEATSRNDQRLTELRNALTEGWSIEPPVIIRPGWSARRGAPLALHLILALQERRRLLVLDDTPASRAFLAEQQLSDLVVR